jgi:pyruvate,water dikinase
VTLELGERLARRGMLAEREDIFFLYLEEIQSAMRGQAQFDVRSTVAARRAEYAHNLTLAPPSVVVGRSFAPEAIDDKAEVLHGLAVSPGVATGPARVILRSDSAERVLPGEILVAPFTDPGWTPYFLTAAGIVVDMGGLLSHGSIIAREYGIPAVVNVGPATKFLRTGQMLRVDAYRGTVQALSAR